MLKWKHALIALNACTQAITGIIEAWYVEYKWSFHVCVETVESFVAEMTKSQNFTNALSSSCSS